MQGSGPICLGHCLVRGTCKAVAVGPSHVLVSSECLVGIKLAIAAPVMQPQMLQQRCLSSLSLPQVLWVSCWDALQMALRRSSSRGRAGRVPLPLQLPR